MSVAISNDGSKGWDAAYHSQSGRSKVDRYGWKIRDAPGTMMMIHKSSINVDLAYQREVTECKVRAIRSNWSWMAFGVLSVVVRGGRYYAYDGSNRLAAAMARSDVAELPCLVFEVDEISREAEGFLLSNSERKPVTAIQKFKAQVITDDPIAIKINEILSSVGYTIRDGGGNKTIACVAALRREVQFRENAFHRVWPIILELADGGLIKERTLCSLCYIEDRLMASGRTESITKNPWKDRFIRLGQDGIDTAIAKASAYYSRGGMKIWADGVLDAVSKGCRTRLSISESNDKS